MAASVRIGNAQGFWGDRGDAAAELLALVPTLDYLTLDYLAEVSMSIMALQRERDPRSGFARDFVEVVRSLAPYWAAGGRCRVITNAGGLDPPGCAEACAAALAELGCRPLRIAVVAGDDIVASLREAAALPADAPRMTGFRHLDTGRPLAEVADRLVTANAYLGAEPLVEALESGAELVITGRVADPSLTVAACRHHHGWRTDDWDMLAGATVAGHLIECGTQVTGGISTDWLDLPDPAHLGFPIVEVDEEGACVVTRPERCGGRVDSATVKEQLVYEIGDPARYLSPDVTVSFADLAVEDLRNDRVRVTGARGGPPPDQYKVSATYRDGFRGAGTLTVVGRNAVEKARRCGEIVLRRVRDAGHVLRDAVVECLGAGECLPHKMAPEQLAELREVVLRIAVEAETRAPIERFARELIPLVTAGPQGITGYAEGRPRPRPVFRYWPCLIDRSQVQPTVDSIVSSEPAVTAPSTSWPPPHLLRSALGDREAASVATRECPVARAPTGTLFDRATARSGDKGIHANIGVVARTAADYPWLVDWLTAERVRKFFVPMGVGAVTRYELPRLGALNFVLEGVLARSLRTDAQGKSLGQALLDLPLHKLAD